MALLLGILSAWFVHTVRGAGPLSFPYVAIDTTGFENITSGERLTYGYATVLNTGDEPVRLIDATLVGGSTDGLEMLGVLTAGITRKLGGVGAARSFPPRLHGEDDLGPLTPLAESVVPEADRDPAQRGVELLVGIKVDRVRDYHFTGLRIRYRMGGRTFTYVDPSRLDLCARSCP